MAFHVIRDEKGRMEKILDDKEYDSYQKRKGCFQEGTEKPFKLGMLLDY